MDLLHLLIFVVGLIYLISQVEKLMATMVELTTQVRNMTAVAKTAVNLIQEMAQRLAELQQGNVVDPQEVQVLVDELNTAAAELSASVEANSGLIQ